MKIKVNYNINAEFQDNDNGFTVAMWMAKKKILNIPYKWRHDKLLKNYFG